MKAYFLVELDIERKLTQEETANICEAIDEGISREAIYGTSEISTHCTYMADVGTVVGND